MNSFRADVKSVVNIKFLVKIIAVYDRVRRCITLFYEVNIIWDQSEEF